MIFPIAQFLSSTINTCVALGPRKSKCFFISCQVWTPWRGGSCLFHQLPYFPAFTKTTTTTIIIILLLLLLLFSQTLCKQLPFYFLCSYIPMEIFLFYERGKKQGNQKRVVYVIGASYTRKFSWGLGTPLDALPSGEHTHSTGTTRSNKQTNKQKNQTIQGDEACEENSWHLILWSSKIPKNSLVPHALCFFNKCGEMYVTLVKKSCIAITYKQPRTFLEWMSIKTTNFLWMNCPSKSEELLLHGPCACLCICLISWLERLFLTLTKKRLASIFLICFLDKVSLLDLGTSMAIFKRSLTKKLWCM